MSGSRFIYAAKGNKTPDFYMFDPVADIWASLAPIPAGREGRMPNRGAVGVADGNGRVYAVKGNNTLGFWCYVAATDSWHQLDDVPLGPSNRKVRGGGDIEYVTLGDTGYVYLLKGYRDDFCRYNTATGHWQQLAPAQTGSDRRWQSGSWLASDGAGAIYGHKARYHEFVRYQVSRDSWESRLLTGMPMRSGTTGRSKKSRDGADGVEQDGSIYALKGGNTQEFWQYAPELDSWYELDTMPAMGSTGRRRKVSYGGDIESYGRGAFFALKGNKTLECWRYVFDMAQTRVRTEVRAGVQAYAGVGHRRLAVFPNPIIGGQLKASFADVGQKVRRACLLDALGRSVRVWHEPVSGSGGSLALDLGGLPAGVYLLRLQTDGPTLVARVVVGDRP
jgi:hypothetical protein